MRFFHLAHPPQHPNLSASALDEGYSTSSQNGWPPCGNPSLSSPPPSINEMFDDAYDTSSRSGTITKKEQDELRDLLKTFEDSSSSGESDNDDQRKLKEMSLVETLGEPDTKPVRRNSMSTITKHLTSAFIMPGRLSSILFVFVSFHVALVKLLLVVVVEVLLLLLLLLLRMITFSCRFSTVDIIHKLLSQELSIVLSGQCLDGRINSIRLCGHLSLMALVCVIC